MKFAMIQPHYSYDAGEGAACFAALLSHLDACDESMDVIVLPEYSDLPYDERDSAAFVSVSRKNNAVLMQKVAETARRCRAAIFVNAFDFTDRGMRNTTFAFDENGVCVGKYYKTHPAPSEVRSVAEGGHGLDVSYSYAYQKPTVLTLHGVRYAFLTCYDFYFYEQYARIARENADVIIGCSLQRTDTHEALEIIGRFLSYQTNAYLVRASVSLGADSPVCGCSMAVHPNGTVLCNMKNRVGIATVELNPQEKYTKPAGYLGRPKPHHEYIEEGRRPWLYRPAGSMMVPDDDAMPYPRICAHRGFSTVAPENSLPAYGAAVALGAEEIEFDLWATKDGELVSIHDPVLDRVSNGTGYIWTHTLAELRALDFGSKTDAHFAGLQIPTFEEILQKFACTTIMNIHVKIWDAYGTEGATDPQFERIAALIRQYDCQRHAYIMTTSDECSAKFHEIAPEIHRCVGWNGVTDRPCEIVDRAIRLGCEKVQLFKPYFDQSAIDKARAHGIRCNVFFADDPAEALRYLEMGADTILTNDYLAVANSVRERLRRGKCVPQK